MANLTLRTALLAGVATAALSAAPGTARASGIIGPPEFQVIESCNAGSGCNGTFDVINNSSNLYIYGFQVYNPFTAAAGTSYTDWNAATGYTCTSGSFCGSSFDYSNPGGASAESLVLANDIGPGSSSDAFTFSSLALASPVELDLVNAQGSTSVFDLDSTHVPEPASLAILGAGLLGLGAIQWRRTKRNR